MDAIGFLRKYGHLDEPGKDPDFTGKDFPGFLHPLAARYAWYRDHPEYYQPRVSGEVVYRSNFNSIGLRSMEEGTFERLPLRDIPDSDEYVLIDVGSGLGRKNTRPFARERPHVRVFMVDSLTKEKVENSNNFKAYPKNDLVGEEFKVRVPITGDVGNSVNELLEANGYPNITYIQKRLSQHSLDLGIEKVLESRRVVVTGYKNPIGLGNTTARLAVQTQAEMVYFNNSAVELIEPGSEHYGLLRAFLSPQMKREEIEKVVSLLYDPRDKKRKSDWDERYDYDVEGERLFASALKLLFALAQKDLLESNGYNVEIYQDNPRVYNGPDHHIAAKKSA